jgi:homoserine kinase
VAAYHDAAYPLHLLALQIISCHQPSDGLHKLAYIATCCCHLLLLLQLLAVSTSKARLRLPKAATFDDYLAAGEACAGLF